MISGVLVHGSTMSGREKKEEEREREENERERKKKKEKNERERKKERQETHTTQQLNLTIFNRKEDERKKCLISLSL